MKFINPKIKTYIGECKVWAEVIPIQSDPVGGYTPAQECILVSNFITTDKKRLENAWCIEL